MPIIEGHGEVSSVPILIRRVAAEVCPETYVECLRPIRISKSKLVKPGELERAVEFASRSVEAEDLVLVLIDADDDCPATLGPELFERARAKRPDRRIRVVVARSEFESWFIAAAESLRGMRGLRSDLSPATDPESIRDAKGWLTDHLLPGRAYSPTVDQPALTAHFDFGAARACRSFQKLWRELQGTLC